MQDHYLTQQWRNSADLRFQGLEHFPSAELPLRISTRSRQLSRLVPAFGITVIQMDELRAAPLANNHQALVLDNPQQPSGKFSFSVELIDVLVCFPTRILCFFFSFAALAKDGCCQIYASAAMAANQLAKRISITLFRHTNKVNVHQFGDVIGISCHGSHIL
jgi:hypothetical protein